VSSRESASCTESEFVNIGQELNGKPHLPGFGVPGAQILRKPSSSLQRVKGFRDRNRKAIAHA
jgi:hypothetical protein